METTFAGWPAEAFALLADIAEDNRADRWPELRERHAAAVRGPTLALANGLAAEFGPVRVFRPHASKRFRPDAPPLRTDTGGVATTAGGCVLGVVLSTSALTVTAGQWRFDRAQLQRYRAAVACREEGGAAVEAPAAEAPKVAATVGAEAASASLGLGASVSQGLGAASASQGSGAPCERGTLSGAGGAAVAAGDSGAELAEVLGRLADLGFALDPDGELRGTPRGWRANHPRIALARRRGLQVVRRWELDGWISTPEPLERVRTAWRAVGPLVAWLDAHVGAADGSSQVTPGAPEPGREAP